MDLHYNAFISYRHHPEDIKVAETIHRALERFKVPKALKKEGKTIERIFRDKEELPITSSLTDTITMALRNSDYQIVICSTHLKDSYWVQREIETFLQTHSKDKVLTVLVDGDNPYDVIPEILTYEDVVDPATGETFREPIEPLSCDWRLPKRKAMKTELPRLAAVLLGCAYDDLIQRQKQYRQRRLIAGVSTGMAASLALAGYFMYTSIQIQENLNQSLRNQSQFLASTSEERFDSGDRLTAISLALAALPNDNDRPYVATAERALTNALMLYEAEKQIISVAAFNSENTVSDFTVTDDGSILYILDSQYHVSAWDTAEQKKLSAFHIGGRSVSSTQLFTDNHGNLITIGGTEGNTLLCYSKDGTLLWQTDRIESIAFCQGKQTLLAIREVVTGPYKVISHYELLHLDPQTGKDLREPMVMFDFDTMSTVSFSTDTYYEGQPVALMGYKNSVQHVMTFDPVKKTLRKVLSFDTLFYGSTVTENNLMYVLVTETNDISNGSMGTYYFHTEAGAWLYCFNMETGKQKWRTYITSYNYSDAQTIAPIPNSDRLFCQYGSAFLQLDTKTGEILEECHSTAIPLVIEMQDTSAWVLFKNGCAGSYTFATNKIGYVQYMESGIMKGLTNHGVYILPQLSASVLLYRSTNDDSYEVFDGEYNDYIDHLTIQNDLMAVCSSGCINLFDLSEKKLLHKLDLGYSYKLLGFNADASKLYFRKYTTIYEMDTATAEYAEWSLLPTEQFGEYSMYYDCIGFDGQTLCCIIYPYFGIDSSIVFTDVTTRESVTLPFRTGSDAKDWGSYGATPIITEMTDTFLLVFAGTGELYRYDRITNEVMLITDQAASDYVFLTDTENDRMYFRVNDGILMTDGSGATIRTIPLTEMFPVSFYRYNDLLMVLGSDGMVHRYDSEGTHLGRTALSVFSDYYNECNNILMQKVPITWAVTPDNELVVNVFRMGNVINTEVWERTCDIQNMVAYLPASDRYLCQANDIIYTYPRHSLEETKELARSVLKGYELTAEQKTAYGLN